MSGEIASVLREFVGKEKLVGFYPWENLDALLVGFVVSVSEHAAVFDLVDTYGQPDERKEYPLDRLLAVAYGEPYFEKLLQLYRDTYWQQRPRSKCTKARAPAKVKLLLRKAATNNELAKIVFSENDFEYAFVDELTKSSALLRRVDPDSGAYGGSILVPLRLIAEVWLGGDSVASVQYLYEHVRPFPRVPTESS